MKKLFTLLCCMAIIGTSMAQFRLAVIGGVHSASVKETNSLPGWESAVKPYYTNRSGLNLGFLVEFPLEPTGHFYLQPGFQYMAKGRKFQQSYDTAVIKTDTLSLQSRFYTNYIDIPLNLTYKMKLGKTSKFFVSAGPYLSFFFNGKYTSETLALDNDDDVIYSKEEDELEVGKGAPKAKTFDYGVNARAGFEFGNFILSGFYAQGLGNFYQASYDGTFKHQVAGASIGFWLNKATPLAAKKPKDTDNDGIPDDQDGCPTQPGNALTKGCPDRDGDGIPDKDDKCPDIPGQLAYKGCPIPDTDGDGLNDHEDKCPNEAGPVSNNGCPLPKPEPDTDGDGVIDKDDKCPNEAGPASNNGCPVIKQEVIEKVNYAARQILFLKGSDKLSPGSVTALEEVVDVLTKNPTLRLNIDGYTDNTGNALKNVQLSQSRSDAVKKYFIDKGISSTRLSALGHGAEKAVADNSTEEGRIRNRRVELTLEQARK